MQYTCDVKDKNWRSRSDETGLADIYTNECFLRNTLNNENSKYVISNNKHDIKTIVDF
jgi:hypothetical protein